MSIKEMLIHLAAGGEKPKILTFIKEMLIHLVGGGENLPKFGLSIKEMLIQLAARGGKFSEIRIFFIKGMLNTFRGWRRNCPEFGLSIKEMLIHLAAGGENFLTFGFLLRNVHTFGGRRRKFPRIWILEVVSFKACWWARSLGWS